MKKILPLALLLALLLACTISTQASRSEERIATRVSLALTQTAMALPLSQASQTPAPQIESTLTPTPSRTPPADDPKTILGNPTLRDDLSTGKNWNLESGAVTYGDTQFSQSSGKLTASNNIIGDGLIWYLSHLNFKNAYLETRFEVEQCSGNDQYGLVFRAKDYNDGLAYYFIVTCSGQYELRRWNTSGSNLLLGMPASPAINKGSDQVNTLGVWADGSLIRLYMNNQLLTELQDDSLIVDGHFGLFINAAETPGFTIHMDEIAYWDLD